MRVLQVIDHFAYGGAERLLATLNSVAPEVDLQLSAASLAGPTPDRTDSFTLLQRAGLQPSFIGARRLADPSAIGRIERAIVKSRAEVVHAHLEYAATLVPLAARRLGVPCVSTLHHLPDRDRPWRELVKEWACTRSAERGGALVYVSEAARQAAARQFGPARSSWRVIHNGVDLSALYPAGSAAAPLPADLLIPAGAPVVTIVAALRGPKGHDVALRAWPMVRAAVPNAVLLIVGDGPERPVLEKAQAEGVVLAGAREDVPEILRASTLALLPSFTEALPTAMIEAAACGLAAVATDVGGTSEIVEHGRTGLLVPPGQPAALAEAVVALLVDPDRRSRYGAAGRLLAEDRFDHRRWARTLADLYRSLLPSSLHLVDRDAVARREWIL